MTVGELLQRTSSAELTDWMAHEQMTGPLDLRVRGDLQMAIICSVIANVNRGKKGRAFKPRDFLPNFDRTQGARTPEAMRAKLIALTTHFGGTFASSEDDDE